MTGQNNLYASAVKDNESGETIIKLVNLNAEQTSVEINPKNIKSGNQMTKIILTSSSLSDENNFQTENIKPLEETQVLKKGKISVDIPANSLVVLKIK